MVKKNKAGKKEKQHKPGKGDKSADGGVAHLKGTLAPGLTKAARSMRTFLTHALSASGLYAGQDGVILLLADGAALPAGMIAARLGVKPPTMTRTLARMEAQGFIERVPDEHDGRQTKARLTELGKCQVGAISYAAKATEAFALSGLTEKEIRQFSKILAKINANFGRDHAEPEAFGE